MRFGALLALTMVVVLAPTAVAGGAGGGRNVDLRGTLVVVHADARASEHTLYYLKRGGEHIRLKFRTPPSVRSQSPVRIRGKEVAGAVEVEAASVAGPAIEPVTTGTRRLLAILARWESATLQATPAGAASLLFAADERSTDRWFRQASYGHLGWTGDVTPVLSIPDPSGCDLYGIAANSRSAAIAAGYDVDAYDHVMVDFPRGRCGADGFGEVGGRISWIIDGLTGLESATHRYVVDHELGHNLGRWHSHGLECQEVTISRACLSTSSSNNEYGNLFDVMGNNRPGYHSGAVGTFSAKPLIELGWFAGRSLDVAQDGSYDLAPLELQTAGLPQALVIRTPAHTYYVEFRQPQGLDAYLAAFPESTNGVHVNMSNDLPFGDNGPLLLDMAPASVSDDFLDAPLGPGESFTDVGGAVRLTVESVTTAAARVRVEFGDYGAPETTITAGPSSAQSSTTATFEFTADEEGAVFECRMDAGDWTSCTSPATFTNLYQGSHVFGVRAWDAADHVDPTEATRTFVVDYSPPAVALTAPAGGTTVAGTVTLGARAQDVLTSVTRVKWFLDGVEVATDATGEPWEKAWRSGGVANGTHKLVGKARDVAGNWGASRSILITVANG